jgi:hypothetical protein
MGADNPVFALAAEAGDDYMVRLWPIPSSRGGPRLATRNLPGNLTAA